MAYRRYRLFRIYWNIRNDYLNAQRDSTDERATARYRRLVIPQVAADRYEFIHDLTARIGIDRMRTMLDEAESAGDNYVTLAELLAKHVKRIPLHEPTT